MMEEWLDPHWQIKGFYKIKIIWSFGLDKYASEAQNSWIKYISTAQVVARGKIHDKKKGKKKKKPPEGSIKK